MAQLTSFQITNGKLQNGVFTGTVNYQMVFGNFDTTSNTKLRVFWYDNSTTTFTDYSISNTVGTINISKNTSGPYITVSGQALALPSTLSGNVLSGGTFYPLAMTPSPPAISTATLSGDPNNNFKITFITDGSTTQISLNIKKPTDSAFSQWLPPTNTPPNGMVPIQLPISNQYGIYSFQGFAINSSGTSPASNIATITINQPTVPGTLLSTNWQTSTIYQLGSDGLLHAIPNVATAQIMGLNLSATQNIPNLLSLYQVGSPLPDLSTPPPQNHSVTIKAINGVSKTFIISQTDDSNLSAVIGSGITIVSDTTTSSSVNSTLNDIGNFIAANGTGGTTGNPPPPTPPPANFVSTSDGPGTGTIRLSWSSQYPVTLTMNGVLRASNLANTNYSLFNQPAGTYTFTLFATNNGVNSSIVQTSITLTNLVIQNYSYNIQIPSVNNALQLTTATNYGTTASISFPAQSFVHTVLNQTISTIPNTLNAIYNGQVASNTNDVQVANALIGYFPTSTTPPPPTGPKPTLKQIAFGLFSSGLAFSLLGSFNSKRSKKR